MSTEREVPFLRVRNVRKSYPGVVALEDASLDVHAGEILALVGKNGAGKSTLMKVLAGVVVPDSGTIEQDGAPLTVRTPHDATAAGLAFVHQELLHAPNLTVAENVLMGLGYPRRGPLVRRKQLEARVQLLLDRLESDVSPRRLVGTLSPAEQRVVMIAHALAQDARLVVLDEPSAALSDEEVEHLHAVARRLAEDGVAVIWISHRLEEVLAITRRVVVMRDGAIVGDAATSDLTLDRLVRLITGEATTIARRRDERNRPAVDYSGEPALVFEHATGGDDAATLEVYPGEILGLAGLVGAGRTELVRRLFGADRGPSVDVRVNGTAHRIGSPRDAVGAGIVLLPEDRRHEGNVLDFSVGRNLTLVTLKRHRWARALGIPSGRSERAAAEEGVRDLRIRTASVETPVRWLSGGNQQKVMLGKWMALGADVYIFDEPTQGIDVGAKEEAFALMDDLARAGKALILIASDFSELVAMCDRVLTMRDGAVVGERTAAAISEAALVEDCYVAT